MFNTNIILTFDYQNEHVLEHDLQMKKNFSNPKIYNANGDISKRWYLYFSYRNPKTGKLQRMKNIYGVVNSYKTKEDRLWVLTAYRKKLLQLLKTGFNPFEDNSELYQKNLSKENRKNSKEGEKVIAINTVKKIEPTAISSRTIKEAFDFALNLKKKVVGVTTYKGYLSKTNRLSRFLATKYPEIKYIDQLTKNMVVQFLNSVLDRTSASNRNNYRIDLSSIMQTLVDNEIIAVNFTKSIPVLKSSPECNKTFTEKQQQDIYKHLEDKDPRLLLFIKFVSYNLLRPIEVCRLQIKDINLEQKTISFKAKNKTLKTKIIPDILSEELPDLSGLDPNAYLFTPSQIGGHWEATEQNKRNYFSKRFKKVVKDHFNFGLDYGLYSFRHTYITKLYRELAKSYAPFDAKSRLMLITGHASMTALEKYLRDIDAELPEDYSALIRA